MALESKFLNVKQTADYLDISLSKAYKVVRANDFPSTQIGTQWKIDEANLDKWIEDNSERLLELQSSTRESHSMQNNNPYESPLLTIVETSKYLKCSVDKVYKLIKLEGLPVKKIGTLKVVKSDLDAWIKECPNFEYDFIR